MKSMMKSIPGILPSLVAACLVLCLGCSRPDGPPRYALSGSASLADGKPIPVGEVMLEPDAAAGNQGPASMSQIRDGKYSLSSEQGVIGGKYIATIIAFDGVPYGESVQGKPLIKVPHVENIELPAADSTKDFQVK